MEKNIKRFVFLAAVVFIGFLIIQGSQSKGFFEKNIANRKSADLDSVLGCMDSCRGMLDGLNGMNPERESRNYLKQVAKLKDKSEQCLAMNDLAGNPIPQNDILSACGQPVESEQARLFVDFDETSISSGEGWLPIIGMFGATQIINCSTVLDNLPPECESDIECIISQWPDECEATLPLGSEVTVDASMVSPDIQWLIFETDSLTSTPEGSGSTDQPLSLTLDKLFTFVRLRLHDLTPEPLPGCTSDAQCKTGSVCVNGTCVPAGS
ncbi:hypothetical protein A2645_01615 [Candidatus Nomurabacteria bacterium RIFCSPHIGHO2_01_FULL_39_9]|uniref:Uncharacterized protein n=1 Tax=Candidatus Nomurabacteria bacterium RIFCSPHIGHO2_01_FULL_39_9 TaxID=1801735 RepID=A0A1F6UV08_9BACT|nr:MAG: hypothetical protein A2645_01615 [Candidatus Nomurabacteria bacterium RIFCSPHIGHO2_01_FULL_39_9]